MAFTSLNEDYSSWGGGDVGVQGLRFVPSASAPVYVYNQGALQQQTLDGSGITFTGNTQYGFAGIVAPASGQPYVTGFLYQNQPALAQPFVGSNFVILGDGPASGATKYYGFFAIPFVTTQNLQAQAESGTLGTGWTNAVDVNADGGHAAKAASGTVAGNADLFGTAWQPPAGQYDTWYRFGVISNAGAVAEMTLGLWDATAGAFVAGGSTTYRANQATTSYSWLKVNGTSPLSLPAGHNVQFRAVTAATLGTDWFIDEAILVPVTLSAGVAGPVDLFQQFLGDFTPRQVRL
jgi:hypothetical protein